MNTRSFAMTVTFGLLGLPLVLLWWASGPLAAVQAAGTPSSPATHTVCPLGPPYCDYTVIQDAVDAANNGDLIKVAAGEYTGVHVRPAPDGYDSSSVITQVVHISKTLTIRGGYSAPDFADPPDPKANPTTLDAGEQGRVIFIAANTSPTLEGLRLTGGTSHSGGGVYTEGALTVRNCIIHQNHAAGESTIGCGGGIHNEGTLAIQNCLIRDNYASGGYYIPAYGESAFGGGIYNGISGTVTMQDTTLRGNGAGGSGGLSGGVGWGGGIHNEGMLVIRRSELDLNGASGGYGVFSGPGWGMGGGINNSGTLIVENTTLSGNTALGGEADGQDGGYAYGGGILNDGTLTIENSTLSGNSALGGDAQEGGFAGGDARGGGILNDGTLTIENSTLSGNSAQGGSSTGGPMGDGQGGGLYDRSGSSVKVSFCTVALNSADDRGGGLYSGTSQDNSGPVIKNTLIGDNAAPAGPDIWQNIQSRGYNLVEDTSGGTLDIDGNGNTAEGNIIGQDPRLGPLQYNGGSGAGSTGATLTHALLDAPDPSPAIDAGSSNDIDGSPVTQDQRGFLRPCPAGGDNDIGAYERGAVDVYMIKEVMPGNAMPGDSIIYTLVFGNDSDMSATGVVISDTVPPSVTVTNIMSHGLVLTGTSTGPIYAWQAGTLLAGDGGVITITGELSASLAAGPITNTALITTTAIEGKPANNSGTAVLRGFTILYLPVVFKE